jgi:cardiolipin synthase
MSTQEAVLRRLTWSNGLTALRLGAAPFFFCAVVMSSWQVAFLLFWLAVATDWIDGRVARARGEASALGALLDHGSDATFVVLGLSALAAADRAPWILPLLVAAAFVQYVLDSRVLAGRPLRASALGSWNGILYFVPIGIVVTRECFGLRVPGDALVVWLGWALVLSTAISMGVRGWALVAGGSSPSPHA